MEAEEILKLENIGQALTLLRKNLSPLSRSDIRKSIKFYENDHPIKHDENLRTTWEKEKKIDPETNVESWDYIKKVHTKLALPYAQQIIMTCAAWLMGKGINLVFTSDDENDIKSYETFTTAWDKSNIITLLREVAKITGIETRAAIQFFYDEESDKIKGKVLCYSKGYEIYRHKDENEKMDCVVVDYKRDKIEDGLLRQQVSTTEIYLKDRWYRYEGLQLIEGFPKPSPEGTQKLLMAYFEQDFPEYWFVMDLIDKQDRSRSQHSDVNTRIGNPALVVNGKLSTKPKINDAVKIYEIQAAGGSLDDSRSSSADMKYLEVSGAPQSVELELKNNERDIYRFTYPDLYALIEKAISGNLSSKSIALMFTHVFAKIAEKQTTWDEMIKRCISIMKDICAATSGDDNIRNLNIGFKYNSLLPSSTDDLITMLATAVGAHLTTYGNAASQLDINDPQTIKIIKDLYDKAAEQGLLTGVQQEKPINKNVPNPDGVNGQ